MKTTKQNSKAGRCWCRGRDTACLFFLIVRHITRLSRGTLAWTTSLLFCWRGNEEQRLFLVAACWQRKQESWRVDSISALGGRWSHQRKRTRDKLHHCCPPVITDTNLIDSNLCQRRNPAWIRIQHHSMMIVNHLQYTLKQSVKLKTWTYFQVLRVQTYTVEPETQATLT